MPATQESQPGNIIQQFPPHPPPPPHNIQPLPDPQLTASKIVWIVVGLIVVISICIFVGYAINKNGLNLTVTDQPYYYPYQPSTTIRIGAPAPQMTTLNR